MKSIRTYTYWIEWKAGDRWIETKNDYSCDSLEQAKDGLRYEQSYGDTYAANTVPDHPELNGKPIKYRIVRRTETVLPVFYPSEAK
jgi:hypothetical protein